MNAGSGTVLLPAESLEEHVVALGAVLDSSEQPHGGVAPQVVVERHRVQVLHRYPSEYRSGKAKTGMATSCISKACPRKSVLGLEPTTPRVGQS